MSSITSLKGTILVADDNESIREPLTELLRLNCYRVIAVDNGEQAFREACSQPVDLVLLDVMMPGPTGFSVCRAIKARPETRFLPVVLITGLACAEDRIRGIEAGADDFLHKPVKNEELLARVRSLVRLKRFTDELENAETVLCSLARSIEAKDPYTEGHCDRLSRYTVSLAEQIGLSAEDRADLRRGGIVHDIGKVAVPEFVLLKPGPLDAAERKIMEEHTIIGERICAPLKSFRNVLPIIRSHHEKQDGIGLSRPFERRGNSADRAHSANRGHLRFAHHRSSLPQGALAGKGPGDHVGRNAPRLVGRRIWLPRSRVCSRNLRWCFPP